MSRQMTRMPRSVYSVPPQLPSMWMHRHADAMSAVAIVVTSLRSAVSVLIEHSQPVLAPWALFSISQQLPHGKLLINDQAANASHVFIHHLPAWGVTAGTVMTPYGDGDRMEDLETAMATTRLCGPLRAAGRGSPSTASAAARSWGDTAPPLPPSSAVTDALALAMACWALSCCRVRWAKGPWAKAPGSPGLRCAPADCGCAAAGHGQRQRAGQLVARSGCE